MYHFIPQIDPPEAQHDPADRFIFQEDKLLVQADGEQVKIPLVSDPAQLDLTLIRRQYLGYLYDAQGSQTHCYSGEIYPTASLAHGLAPQGLRETYAQLDEICCSNSRAVPCRSSTGSAPTGIVVVAARRPKTCPVNGQKNAPTVA